MSMDKKRRNRAFLKKMSYERRDWICGSLIFNVTHYYFDVFDTTVNVLVEV